MLNVLVDRCALDNSHPIISVLTLCPLLELVLHIGNLSFRYLHISVVCQCCMSSSSSIPPYFQCKTLPDITRGLDMSCPRKSEANFDPFQVSFITIYQHYSCPLASPNVPNYINQLDTVLSLYSKYRYPNHLTPVISFHSTCHYINHLTPVISLRPTHQLCIHITNIESSMLRYSERRFQFYNMTRINTRHCNYNVCFKHEVSF